MVLTVDAPPATGARPLPPRRASVLRRAAPLWLGLPAIIVVIVTQGYPLVTQIIMSFQEFGLAQQFGQPAEWIGLDNYIRVMTDPVFWGVMVRSVVFGAVVAGLTMVIGVLAALLMTKLPTVIRVALQVSMLLAWAMPHLSSLTVWQWLFNTRNGVVNTVLVALGFEQFRGYAWLLDPASFFVIAGAVVIWGSVPLVMFMVYASVTQVDESIMEAAQLDGAGPFRRFFSVTMPIIAPVLFLVGMLQIIWDLRVFTQISVLQDAGGVTSDTNVLGTYIYQIGLGQGDYGQGSAIAMIMLVLTLVLTAGYVRQLLKNANQS
ncbi:carbohydrate ABC transporter permease [Labedella populi]|uniref:carbohydrate ABC transporter permease n=1 Tax=Labedella populi TaxID=2498850 RepID=UPI001AA02796|nr:sugar ABC transporter permease [Labedella populi]